MLTRHYLEVGSDGDASPIRAFGVTPETLASIVCVPETRAFEAVAAFKVAVGTGLVDALEHGWSPMRRIEGCPGYFSYLVLTLLVASLVDAEKGLGGDFRRRLKEFTGLDRSFNDLHGVAEMWVRLVGWLDARRVEGLALRPLVLPKVPETWVHIGYTRKLAFPSKSDVRLLKRFLQDKPELLESPRRFVFALATLIEKGRASDGLKEAFRDFREAFEGGQRLLADHHLWRFASSCLPHHDDGRPGDATIEVSYDEDGSPWFAVIGSDADEAASVPGPLSEAVADAGSSIPTLRYGFLVFGQVGYGRWRTVARADGGPSRVLFACSFAKMNRLRARDVSFVASGLWSVTSTSVPLGIAEAFAASLGASPSDDDDRLVSATVSGGILADGAWLGRPAFLPRIVARGEALELRSGPGAEGDMSVRSDPIDRHATRLVADGPVSGTWTVGPSQGSQSWSRRMTFVRNALPREPAAERSGTALGYEPVVDWTQVEDKPMLPLRRPQGWAEGDPRLADLVEALYAGGRSGWDEGSLTALVLDALGSDVDPWLVLRSLRDASFVRPFLRPRWKGRVWFLEPIGLRLIGPTLAVVDGAPCEMLMTTFRDVCEALGGRAFRVLGAAPLAPMLVGCAGGDLSAIARRMGWPTRGAHCCRGGRAGALVETLLTTRLRQPASRWDWRLRHFVADGRIGDGAVQLTRWAQPGGRDHDVYVVEAAGRTRRFVSRAAAVLAAHLAARQPLFTAKGSRIVTAVREAALPDRIAARLRLVHASNPGLASDGYAYPVGEPDLCWLTGTLPGLVSGGVAHGAISREDTAATVRHSRRRWRSAWIDGEMRPEPAAIPEAKSSGGR